MTTRRSFLKWFIGVLAVVALAQRVMLDAPSFGVPPQNFEAGFGPMAWQPLGYVGVPPIYRASMTISKSLWPPPRRGQELFLNSIFGSL